MLGTGRVDHRAIFLISKKFGNADVNFNAAYLNVGREYFDRRASGAQVALNSSYEFKNNWGVTGEVSGQSEDYEQPKGVYALAHLTPGYPRRAAPETFPRVRAAMVGQRVTVLLQGRGSLRISPQARTDHKKSGGNPALPERG